MAFPSFTALSGLQSFVRGVLANWLVCIAVWCAAAASSLPGKVLGLYIPILTFVAIGLEHSVANMFLIPMVRPPPLSTTFCSALIVGLVLPFPFKGAYLPRRYPDSPSFLYDS